MPPVKDDLPELPKALWWYTDESQRAINIGFCLPEEKPLFTADQLQSYARLAVQQAVLVERERCAKIAENFPTLHGFHSCFSVAAAIRNGNNASPVPDDGGAMAVNITIEEWEAAIRKCKDKSDK